MNVEYGLPSRWVQTTLGDVLPIQYGKGLVEAIRDPNGQVPVYGSSGIVGSHNHALTSKAALIIGRKGSIGSVHYSPVPCWPIDTTYFVEESTNIDLKFFLYLLTFLKLNQLDKSTAVPGLSRDDYNMVVAPLPPLPEQRRIVAAIEQQFSRLDAGVAALRQAQAKLKRYRAAVLKAAVEGKLTESWRAEHPTTEPASQLLERILAERRAKWEADLRAKGKDPAKVRYVEPAKPDVESLPELPEGWCYTLLPPLLSIVRKGITTGPFGSLLKKHEHRSDGVPVLGIENIAAMHFVPGSKIYISRDKSEQLSQYDAQPGDILISRSGTVGEVCVVPDCLGEARISTNLMRVTLAMYGMMPQFFCLLFNGSPFVLNQVSELCKGSTRDFLSQAILASIVFPLPPLTEQEQIVAEVERRLSVISQLEATAEANLKRAERLRQSILKEAFAGRLVPQDPDDESASVLLERIRRDREKQKHGALDKGREVICEIPKPKKIDVKRTKQVELWESVESGE